MTLKFGLQITVIENGKLGYGFLFAFHSNYGRIFSAFDTIHECDRHPESQPDTARRHRHSIVRQNPNELQPNYNTKHLNNNY